MSTITTDEELGQAMTEAELTPEERETVQAMLEGSDASAEEAIAAALAMRDAEPDTPEAPSSEAPSSEPTDKQLKELDKENTRHVASVRRIMGSFVEGFGPCTKCDTIGLEPPGQKPRAHDFYQACATCNGFGQVLTGSLEQQYAAVNCPDCGGRGYLEAMIDNTPAAELVKGLRASRAAVPPQGGFGEQPLPAQPSGGEVVFGRPAWMGDPALGQ